MILMNDFKDEPEALKEAMYLSARRVIESGWYVLGKELETFETEWGKVCNVSHAIGVGNGMDAIEIALRSLNIGHGDEVVTTSMTAFATVLAILRAGATPILADIEPDSALMSIDSVKRCITKKTKAIVLVHLYGQVRNMQNWVNLCEELDINLIEDCAQAHLAEWGSKVAGSFGMAGAYSFYPTKNLGALGDAGVLVTSDQEVSEKARRLRNYGQSVRYYHPDIGMNSRLDEMQAAILTSRLAYLTEFTNRRRVIASAYHRGINNTHIALLSPPEESSAHVYHLYVVTCAYRDELQEHLKKFNIQTLIHYPIPIQLQEPCKSMLRDNQGLNNSVYHASHCISLPCHPQMSDDDIDTVISAVNSFSV